MSHKMEEIDERVGTIFYEYDALLHTDHEVFVPTENNLADIDTKITSTLCKLDRMDICGEFDELVAQHCRELLRSLSFRLEDERAMPHRYLADIGYVMDRFCLLEAKPNSETAPQLFEHRLQKLVLLVKQVTRMLPVVTSRRRMHARQYLDNLLVMISNYLANCPFDEHSVKEALTLLGSEIEDACGIIDHMHAEGSLLESDYGERLKEVWSIDLETLLCEVEGEFASCKNTVKELMMRFHDHKDISRFNAECMQPLNCPAEAHSLMKKYLNMAKAECRKYMSLPVGEACQTMRVPSHMSDSYPWGGCMSPSPLSDNLHAAVLLNETNCDDLSHDWLKMLAVHECYPGHHTQRVKVCTSNLPLSFKFHTLAHPSAALVEGMAHRSEKLCGTIFGEEFGLFVAYRRLHTAARIMADLALHVRGDDTEEVVKFYESHLGFSHSAARGQVNFQLLLPGYMTTYNHGLRRLEEISDELELDEPFFNEALFSAGFVSLNVFKKLLRYQMNN